MPSTRSGCKSKLLWETCLSVSPQGKKIISTSCKPASFQLKASSPWPTTSVVLQEIPLQLSCRSYLDNVSLHVCLLLQTPELDAVPKVGSSKTGIEGEDGPPLPAGHTALDAAQDLICFMGCECTLLGHVMLLVNQHQQVLPKTSSGPC